MSSLAWRWYLLLLSLVPVLHAQEDCTDIDEDTDIGPGWSKEQQTNFFDALRKAESDGDLCKISDDGRLIGPYQISEEFYNMAVQATPNLQLGGKHVVVVCLFSWFMVERWDYPELASYSQLQLHHQSCM